MSSQCTVPGTVRNQTVTNSTREIHYFTVIQSVPVHVVHRHKPHKIYSISTFHIQMLHN